MGVDVGAIVAAIGGPAAIFFAWKGVGKAIAWLLERRSERIETLEDLIDLLRRELDKGRVRENAAITVAQMLVFAVDQVADPTPAMVSARAHARDIVAAAHSQLKGGQS